jgi:predicted DNA-binding protein (MmcQ/YjbR family)
MDIDWVRHYCLSLPHTTEKIQWEDNLVFKVGGKMFAVMPLERGHQWLSFKCTLEEFAELIEHPRINPAPYLARAHWVALESPNALPRSEVERLLRDAHGQVLAKLPKKIQAQFERSAPRKPRMRRP